MNALFFGKKYLRNMQKQRYYLDEAKKKLGITALIRTLPSRSYAEASRNEDEPSL